MKHFFDTFTPYCLSFYSGGSPFTTTCGIDYTGLSGRYLAGGSSDPRALPRPKLHRSFRPPLKFSRERLQDFNAIIAKDASVGVIFQQIAAIHSQSGMFFDSARTWLGCATYHWSPNVEGIV